MKRWMVRYDRETGEVVKIASFGESWPDTRPRLYESKNEKFAVLYINAIDELGAYTGFLNWKEERDYFDKERNHD